MLESHKHLGLSNYEFDVTAHEIKNTLDQFGVPQRETDEFMGTIESYRSTVVQAGTPAATDMVGAPA